MYSSSSILALRAKGQLYNRHRRHHHHHRYSGDWATGWGSCCGRCCHLGTAHPSCAAAGFPARSVFPSSRLLYGYWLRQSALIRWAPCRIVVSHGGGEVASAAARYRRLSAAWDRDLRPEGEFCRWSKCSASRFARRAGVPDGGFQDMLCLLAEVEECFGATDGAAEEACVPEKVWHKPYEGKPRRFYENESDSSREGDRAAWRSDLSSSSQAVSSSSISGDSGSTFLRRRHRDDSSRSYSRNGEMEEKGVHEVWKREDDSRSRRRFHASDGVASLERDTKKGESRTRDREDATSSLRGSVHQSRGQYVQKGRYVTEQKESKEELEKVSKASHLHQSDAMKKNFSGKKTCNVTKEESVAVDLLEVVRRQQNEILQLRKDYQNLLITTQVHNANATRASESSSLSNTRVEDLGGTTLPMDLLSEVRRQRNEIEQLNENYQKLIRAYKLQESSIMRETTSKKSFGTTVENRVESSTSGANLVGETTVRYCNMDKLTIDDSRTASQMLTKTDHMEKGHQKLKTSGIHESDSGKNSNYKKFLSTISEDRERKSISAVNLIEGVQEHCTNIALDQQNIRHADSRTGSQKLTERADICSGNTETASISQKHYATRMGDQKEHMSSAVNLIKEREQQASNIHEQVSQLIDSRRSSQKHTDMVEIHKSDKTEASRIEDHVEIIVKDQEDNSNSVQHLVQLTKDKRVQIDQRVIKEINVRKDTGSSINISEAFRGKADNASAAFGDHEKNSVSALNLVHEAWHPRNEDGKRATQQVRLRDDSQGQPEFLKGGPVNVSEWQMSSSSGTNSGDDYASLVLFQETKEKKKADLVGETSGASSGTSECFYSPGHMQSHESDYQIKSDGLHLVKDDIVESAMRLDKASSHYVGEFVDQLQQKVSAFEETDTTSYNSPEAQMEASHSSPSQKPKATAEHKDETCKQEGAWHYSSTSEVAGPSDEVWDVRGGASQEDSSTAEPENSSSVGALGTTSALSNTSGPIIKRSSRSLWSYIADILRMGWSTRTTSQKSMLKSATRSSSDESLNSDAWYSGHEPEDEREEKVKNGRKVTWKELEINKEAVDKPHSRMSPASSQVASGVTRPGEDIMPVELGVSIPIESVGGGYGSNGSPPEPGLENLVPVDGGKAIEGVSAVVATASQSALLGSTSVSTYEEETESDRVHSSEVDLIKSQRKQKTEIMPEAVVTEKKDVELKRRKLQRSEQVLGEELEEWEEAYKLESEQRKADETFMREALLEAKKAADMWEVPVGAVLVQDGKIIARGCNLVEDLRDSTAHAEMICIREASSLLRTWRLAGTTLYVTLEPCAMCAGAILQARIDAVVWGSPNKLLGADGSWVRLFPGGDEGKQGLDQSNQAVGPVHPFHPKITIRRGVLATECSDTMQQFFQLRRKKKKPEPPPPRLPIGYPAKLLTKMHNIFCMMACM